MEKSKFNPDEQSGIGTSKLDQLEGENPRLLERLEEVVKMNTHWQRYDAEREEHVCKLTKTNQKLLEQVRDLQLRTTDIGKKEEESEGKRSTTQCDERKKTEPRDVRMKEEEVEALSDKIGQLRVRIAELEISRVCRKREDDDQVALLREQVNVCVEDFKRERRDRERIHGDNLRLRQHLAEAENKVGVSFSCLYFHYYTVVLK